MLYAATKGRSLERILKPIFRRLAALSNKWRAYVNKSIGKIFTVASKTSRTGITSLGRCFAGLNARLMALSIASTDSIVIETGGGVVESAASLARSASNSTNGSRGPAPPNSHSAETFAALARATTVFLVGFGFSPLRNFRSIPRTVLRSRPAPSDHLFGFVPRVCSTHSYRSKSVMESMLLTPLAQSTGNTCGTRYPVVLHSPWPQENFVARTPGGACPRSGGGHH